MAEKPSAGSRVSKFDRVSAPNPTRSSTRDRDGKVALYSTAPEAAPSSPVMIICERCDVEKGLDVKQLPALIKPPFLWNPISGKLWTRCPTCGHRSWLRVRKGQALRALLDRQP